MFGIHTQGRRRTLRSGQSGFAMPLAMTITVLVLVIGLAFIEMNRVDATLATRDVQDVQAVAAAELGLAQAQAMAKGQQAPWCNMRYGSSYLTWFQDPDYSYHYTTHLFTTNGNGSPPIGTTLANGATYYVVVEALTSPLLQCGTYCIHAYGGAGSYTRQVTTAAQTVTFASFGWLTNSENGVYFTSGDTVDGWLYTNDYLYINGTPTFRGKVNSARSSVSYRNGGPPTDNPDFQQGLYLNSTALNLSSLVNSGQITAIQNAANSGGIAVAALPTTGSYRVNTNKRWYTVQFNAAGTVTITYVDYNNVTRYATNTRNGAAVNAVPLSTLNLGEGAIYIQDTVQTYGTVNGHVTMATPTTKDVQIIDNLVYANPASYTTVWTNPSFDPTDPSFDDKLGIIAGRDLVINKPWSSTPAWTDMYVMGSMLAVTGSFRNASYTSSPQKDLNLYGGIAQQTRGAVGQINGTGFLKNYKYDTRFMTSPPPQFPVVTYDFNSWDADWVSD